MANSCIPVVKAATVEIIGRNEKLAAVKISYGDPGRDLADETVVVGGVSEWDQDWASIGNGRRKEEFTIDVFVIVTRAGDQQQEATERAFEIFEAVEDEIRAATTEDFNLPDDAQITHFQVVVRDAPEFIRDAGYAQVINAGIEVKVRI